MWRKYKMISTTLRMLRTNKKQKACTERYAVLRIGLGKNYGDNKLIPLTRILEINGRDDVLWALENVVDDGYKILRLWAADCAEHVLPIYEKKYPNDKRPADAIKAARQFARGEITEAASDAASATADDAANYAASYAVGAAASDAAEVKWQTNRLIQYLNEEVK